MNALATFVHECLASGGLLIALAATLFLPFVAWTLTRPALRLLGAEGAPRPRAVVFATLATAPGVSFAIGTATIVVAAYRSGCLNWLGGRAILTTILSVFALLALRAAYRAYRRQAEVRALRTSSGGPEARLALAARTAGIQARRVISKQRIFCVVGWRTPVVLVSDSALALLTDSELDASLAHEHAHARHFDQLVMALVMFFADLLPLPVDDLVDGYRVAREFAADRVALQSVDALDLAQAIYRLAVPYATNALGSALADSAAVARIRALLEPAIACDARMLRKLSFLIAGQGLAAATLVALVVPLSTCRMVL